MYRLIIFDRSVNDFNVFNMSGVYVYCVQEAVKEINKEIDRLNQCKGNSHLDHVDYDEIYEIFDNGQNYIIGNYVFGIISIKNMLLFLTKYCSNYIKLCIKINKRI